MRVAYFTAGSVGAGHLARGVALERALHRRDASCELRAFSCPTAFDAQVGLGHVAVPIDHRALLDPTSALDTPLGRALSAFDPDLVLVDLFWAPVHHLLPHLRSEAWLLLRSHPRHWLVGPPELPFSRDRYARIFTIEPHVTVDGAEPIDPIVVVDRDDRAPAGSLRAMLDVPLDASFTLVVHAGRPGERATLEADARAIEPDAVVRVCDLFTDGAPFPIARMLGDADRIVGGAGYNLFWETRALGLADRTALRAFPRSIDDQAMRLRACAGVVPRTNGADAIAAAIVRG